MSRIPKVDDKPKYNSNKPYEWVDSQWEKFMTEQKELKRATKQLQDDLVTCNKHFQIQRKQMEDLVSRVPSTYLTDSAKFSGETHPDAKHIYISLDDTEEQKYIYERNPDTGEIFRRRAMDYDNRECINPEVNSVPNI